MMAGTSDFRGVARDPDTARLWHRNQRDAGIEFKQWEGRLKPRRSWLSILSFCAMGLILVAVIFGAMAGLSGAADMLNGAAL